jgi:hypothetical protein
MRLRTWQHADTKEVCPVQYEATSAPVSTAANTLMAHCEPMQT